MSISLVPNIVLDIYTVHRTLPSSTQSLSQDILYEMQYSRDKRSFRLATGTNMPGSGSIITHLPCWSLLNLTQSSHKLFP